MLDLGALAKPKTPKLTQSPRIAKIEARKREKWREDFAAKRARQVTRWNKPAIKFNTENAEAIKARTLKPKPLISELDRDEMARIESLEFAPSSRLVRYALDAKRKLTKGERSREFNTRYIDRVTGQFISKDDAKATMQSMREERQNVRIMLAKNISYSEAKEWRQHLLDTKDLSYIIRIYGS